MKLEFDHVAVAVPELDVFRTLLERLTGQEGSPTERVESQGVDVCFVGPVEVIAPHGSDSGVGRFLERRGAGLHHIAYRVADLEGTMARMTEEGYRFTQEEPAAGRGGHRVAFLHPASTGGVLIEFLEHPGP
ncbi:MAG: VOC family protein [Gemmatimonadetes bacterium]|nr:VOC family protein [Gemmatimonadota bacterium]NNM33220.1 VOC family protein [Gemmatimonadota bacterium]